MTDYYCQQPTTEDGGIVICEQPATGTATTSEGRPYPACGEHVTRPREAKTTTTEGELP